MAGKIPRTSAGLSLKLRATTDVIATLAARVKRQPSGRRRATWCVAFALEPGADKTRACAKITAKQCDLIVVNDVAALESTKNAVAVYDARHELVGERRGTKPAVATWLIRLIEQRLMGA
jgi:phosphopantothenoylcysteine synthetase/decarboxylase